MSRDGWKEFQEGYDSEMNDREKKIAEIREALEKATPIDYVGQSVAGQALSTTEPCVCESIKCECGYHEPNGVERVRYAYTCPNCENLIEPEDASKAGMRCPTCRVKEIVPFTIVINAAKGDGNDA